MNIYKIVITISFLIFASPFSFGQLFEFPDKINTNKAKAYFKAERTGNLNVLTWGGSEYYDYFLVQKSTNGIEYTTLGKVKVTRRYKAKDFVFIDNSNINNNEDVYYRIIKYKKNSQCEYTEEVIVPARKVCVNLNENFSEGKSFP